MKKRSVFSIGGYRQVEHSHLIYTLGNKMPYGEKIKVENLVTPRDTGLK